jgi:hypothetical protein
MYKRAEIQKDGFFRGYHVVMITKQSYVRFEVEDLENKTVAVSEVDKSNGKFISHYINPNYNGRADTEEAFDWAGFYGFGKTRELYKFKHKLYN